LYGVERSHREAKAHRLNRHKELGINHCVYQRNELSSVGICVYLIMPRSATACFQVFLDALSRKFARLALPYNISLLFLPPYSPELNPKETLWDEIHEKIFKNYALKSKSSRRSSTSNAIPQWSNPSPHSPTSASHFDVEMVSRDLAEGVGMSRRKIVQEELLFNARCVVPQSSLDELDRLIDWASLAYELDGIHSASKGEPAWPPLALFKALLIAVWYDLSDVKLAEALDDRAFFRLFCGFSTSDVTPERTAFVRFRKELVARGLDKALFDIVTRQLKTKAVTVKTGTLVDATVIAPASHQDGEAGWAAHRTRKAVHGFKAHVGADADTALVEELSVTLGNVHDGRAGHGALPDDPGAVYATAPTGVALLPPRCRPKEGFHMSFKPAYGDVTATARCKS
jgi:IS5 family transposase